MRIVNIAGGLGNQMFQYAFAIMLQKRYPSEQVMIDISHYKWLMFKRVLFRSQPLQVADVQTFRFCQPA